MYRHDSACGAACLVQAAAVVTTTLHEFAESLGNAVDAKDPHTRRHSDEVAEVAHALALRMGLSPREADVIHVAAHLHDVGKIALPDAVLFKSAPLTGEEWDLVRKHPVIGADIVRPVRELRQCGVLDMILHHHERFDGKGYPDGLAGEDIPLGARIIALADSLSAMLQSRPYRKAMSFETARMEIAANAGSQFDPRVVRAFMARSEDIRAVMETMRLPLNRGK